MDAVERLTLEAVSARTTLAATHVHRYELAARLCEGLRVLDLACGSGYGSRILRGSASSVVGVDNDVATIDMASATIGRETDIEFVVADAVRFLEQDLRERFDAIVMFEGLEHLHSPERALAGLRRHAEDGLGLVISVPNSKAFDEDNPFHETDFGYDEVLAAFRDFPNVVLLYQFLAEGSLITAEQRDGAGEGHFVLEDHAEEPYASTFIACANFEDALAAWSADARLHFAVSPVSNRYLLNLQRANVELRRVNARLARGFLGKADSAAASLVARVEDAERALAEATPKQEWVEHLQAETHRRGEIIDEMQRTRAWRMGQRYWRARDALKRIIPRNRP
jgi:SAM-dependent methyltransferase